MKYKMRKVVSILLVLLLAIAFLTVPKPVYAEHGTGLPADFNMDLLRAKVHEARLEKYKPLREALQQMPYLSESVRIFVELSAPAAEGTSKSEASVVAGQKSIQKQVRAITKTEVINSFGYLANGFSLMAKRSDFLEIEKIAGVKKVTEVPVFFPDMLNAVKMTKATQVWSDFGFKGEGMLVSIVDTGIDYNHKDMRISDASKVKMTEQQANDLIHQNNLPGRYFTEKVPYGFNYADKNQNVIDGFLSGRPEDAGGVSQHGMHVAGIVAANTTDEDLAAGKGIRGVAPEAQLLAMKVFSNHQSGGAWADDILMAIQDSVKLGADIVNMSLGSPSGFSDLDNAFARGVTKATEAGTLVVISAGNEGLAYDPEGRDSNTTGFIASLLGLNVGADSGSVGHASTVPAALSVASLDNTVAYLPTVSYSTDATGQDSISLSVVTQEEPAGGRTFKDGEWIEIVDCGLGKPDEVPAEVSGKYALAKRGELSFKDKATNAAAKGAIGIIIYNNSPEATILGMSTVEESGISSLFAQKVGGEAIKALLDKKEKVYVDTSVVEEWGSLSDLVSPSSFTSWGPAPELTFKPEVAAPGGMIYSTLNGNSYGLMSGTSMSSPHTAGAAALVAQAMADKDGLKALTGADRTSYLKTILSNTAVKLPDLSKNSIHSPRRVGAGLINVKGAIDSQVTVTYNGKGNVELKDFTGEKTFTLTFKNYGSEDVTFEAQDSVVYTANHAQKAYDFPAEEASLTFSTKTVTVPANGEVTLECTLNPGKVDQNYVEGYIEFKANGASVPDLSIPYMGFVGSWANDLRIFDYVEGLSHPALGDAGYYDFIMPELDIPQLARILSASQLYFDNNTVGLPTPAGNWFPWVFGEELFKPETVGFTTDMNSGNYTIKELTPHIGVFRGVKGSECFITDKDGNEIRQVGWINAMRKPAQGRLSRLRGSIYEAWGTSWDGKLYDATVGEFVNAPEGSYTYNIRARMDGGDWQTMEIPFKLDNTPPSFTVPAEDFKYDPSSDTVTLVFEDATDGEGTGIDPDSVMLVYFNGFHIEAAQKVEIEGTTMKVTVPTPAALNNGAVEASRVMMFVADYVGYDADTAIFNVVPDTTKTFIKGKRIQEISGTDVTSKHVQDNFVTYNADEITDLGWDADKPSFVIETSTDVEKLTVDGVDAAFLTQSLYAKEWKYDATGAVDGVPMDFVIKALDAADAELATDTVKLLVDVTIPSISITEEIKQNSKGIDYIEPTNVVHVTISDNYAEGVNMLLGFNGLPDDGSGKDFIQKKVKPGETVEIPVYATHLNVFLVPVDAAGNMGFANSLRFFVRGQGVDPEELPPQAPPVPPAPAPEPAVEITDPPYLAGLLASEYAFVHLENEAESLDVEITGTHENIGSLSIDGTSVTLLGDGTWKHTLHLVEGVNYINVNAFDNNTGAEIYNTKLRIFCDGKVPNLKFETDPEAVPGTFVFPAGTPDPDSLAGNREPLVIWTNQDAIDVNIKGTASDNTFGYKLWINGDVVLDYYDLEGKGPQDNEKDFEHLLEAVKVNDFIRLEIRDLADFNSPDFLLQKIQVRQDTTAPVLTPYYKTVSVDPEEELVDKMEFNVEDEVILSAKATDEAGGSGISDEPTIEVDGKAYDGKPLEAGVHVAVFRVKDRAGNETVVVRTIVVYGDPILTVGPDEEIYPEDVAAYDPMVGVSAKDPVIGDVTDKVQVTCDNQSSFDAGVLGTYKFTYTVTVTEKFTRSGGRTATATKNVRILGRPELFGVIDATIQEGDSFDPMAGVTALDNEDGDLTDKIIVEGSVDTSKPGTYVLKYHVYDSHGNKAEAERTITVNAIAAPPAPEPDPEPEPQPPTPDPNPPVPVTPTGEAMSPLFYAGIVLIVVGVGLVLVFIFKKKKGKDYTA